MEIFKNLGKKLKITVGYYRDIIEPSIKTNPTRTNKYDSEETK